MARTLEPTWEQGWSRAEYLDFIRREVPDYERLHGELVAATAAVAGRTILDLGFGTGETARRTLAAHPGARLVGVDASATMLAAARSSLDPRRVRLEQRRLEDPLPDGPFELAVSALAIHHLDAAAKADLFRRLHAALVPGARFVLADVVVPERAEDVVTPADAPYDQPSTVPDQLDWLEGAGFVASVVWSRRDLAVLVGVRR